MASRLLLAPGHSHGGRVVEDEHAGEADHAEDIMGHLVHASTLDLRIAAVFVVWFGAALFGLPTLLFKQFRDPDAVVPRLLRAFAGGVIVALALVHIIPSAVGELNSLMVFPIGGCTILFGIVILVLVDNCLAAFLAPEHYKQQIKNDLAAKKGSADFTDKHEVAHKQHDHHASESPAVHGHQCLRSMSATGWMASETESRAVLNIRQYVTAYTMELGCIFHSIIIGVGVGVITEDRPLVVTLMIALAIHQGLEALALGSVLALTRFHYIKKLSMLLVYSITTPIGIAIGIAVAAGYDPDSVTSRAVQGTLNGVSGGMLLYIGMYQLIAEEFSRDDLLVRPKMRYGMYAGLILGAASMCVLGIWA